MTFDNLPKGQRPGEYFNVVPPDLISGAIGVNGLAIGSFELPYSFIRSVDGGVQIRLPALAAVEDGAQFQPNYIATSEPVFGHVEDIYDEQIAKGGPGENPSTWTVDGQPATQLFWQPRLLSTKVILSAVGDYLEDAQIATNLPSTGTEENRDFVWTGGFGLAPSLSTRDPAVEDRHQKFAFISGILFAVAASSLVALIQEIPGDRPEPSIEESRVGEGSEATDERGTSLIGTSNQPEVARLSRPVALGYGAIAILGLIAWLQSRLSRQGHRRRRSRRLVRENKASASPDLSRS